MVARFENDMVWIADEISRQGTPRIVSHRGWYRPLSRRHRFQIDNGLYVTSVVGIDDSLVLHFTLMGRADGTIVTPGAGEHAKFERAFRGYRRRLLGRSRKPVGGLPAELTWRLDQAAAALSVAGWWLVLTECTDPRLLERGFPAWRITYLTLGGPSSHLFRHIDTPSFAGSILSLVNEMRSLLEDVRKAVSIAGPGTR